MGGAGSAGLVERAGRGAPEVFAWGKGCVGSMVTEAACKDGGQGEDSLNMPISVLSNGKGLYGAACMVYPGVLEALGAEEGRGFYIIPSSVHEVLLLGDTGGEEPRMLRQIIEEINHTHLAPEEVLSDNLYYYNFAEKRIKII